MKRYRRGVESSLTSRFILCFIILIVTVCILYPFLYCLAYSLSDNMAVMTRNVTIYPIDFTLKNYKEVFRQPNIFNSFLISVGRAVGGIVWTLTLTGLAAYACTRKSLPGVRGISLFLIIPMYISGGLIPVYVLMYKLRMVNNFLVYVLPHGFWAFNMLLMRTYFETIPESLAESARLDGAGDLRIFTRIIFPLSMPIVAVISMYSAVWQWNAWFDAMLYVTKSSLRPLQALLQELIMKSMATTTQMASAAGRAGQGESSPEAIRMATLMFTTLPIVCVYPFFQKYFVRGVMLGAVKE